MSRRFVTVGDDLLLPDSVRASLYADPEFPSGGEKGDPGTDGKSAYQLAVDSGFVGTEAAWLSSLQGSNGSAASVSVGTVSTGLPGSQASVSNRGTSSVAVLDFAIPQGAKGDTGSDGAPGADGAPGIKGDPGADGASIVVTLVPDASWPPAPDSDPNHWYVRVP